MGASHFNAYTDLDPIMDIRTEHDITPEVVRQLRKDYGLFQREFWESVGSTQPSGHWFESGKRKGIPKSLRILIFLRYVAKLDLDVSDPDKAAQVVLLGQEISARIDATRAQLEAREAEKVARAAAKQAKNVVL